ncbi:MAG: hypothetical protein ACSLFN_04915 [Candidatus Limnocylindrales bacterium]
MPERPSCGWTGPFASSFAEVGIINVDGCFGWSWSPDGKSILEVAQNVPDRRLEIAPLDGGPPTFVEETGLIMTWSPAGDRVLMRTENTQEVYSIDPASGDSERLDWNAANLPDWQRRGE